MTTEKLNTANWILNRSDSVFIHLDPTQPGVVVPEKFRSQEQMVLQIGWNMPVPIPDLRIDEDGVFGTLSFSGQPFCCFIPWRVVYAVVGPNSKGMVWEKDMPQTVLEKTRAATAQANANTASQDQSNSSAPVISINAWREKRGYNPESNPFARARSKKENKGVV